ncbi:hypothetical protein Salmuc_00031 [Salipiger mucosus DSM 16094]|uniref:Uncharacterized protein n=1 Tax=Salipiger mucosus DSM 16094 TaxID=1123237 RepID=S9R547_9RHOB|nr:hypothetical protein Salmuc_00031 [Salipiger mucosus DSM 16094]
MFHFCSDLESRCRECFARPGNKARSAAGPEAVRAASRAPAFPF